MPGSDDVIFMRRCLELAGKAEGMTYPNPLVGSVIVHNGTITGEGYHLKAGGPHAEVNAINSLPDKSMLRTSALYVNLEPCSHFGKTTPCADLIIANKIPRIIVGTIDTSEKVSGQGLKRLREAGCEVISGILNEECRYLNRRFFTFHEKKRPYITLKWAQSSDGFIDKIRSEDYMIEPNWITGEPERVLVHKWRAEEQAILVGAGTARADNPRLNVREWKGNDPLKIILSGSGIVPDKLAANNFCSDCIIFTYYPEKVNLQGAVKVKLNREGSAALQITEYLFKSGVQSLFIEGGAKVLYHFISAGCWDEARIFYGNTPFRAGIKAPEIHGKLFSHADFSQSSLKIFVNKSL